MADFPTATPAFRALENLPHVTYDATQKKTIYAEDMTKLQQELLAVMSFAQQLRSDLDTQMAKQEYKVGDIFLSFNSTNPATVKGYGTWSLVAKGRTLVGVDTAQTEFNTVRKSGGHKLLQAHNHAHRQWIFNGAGSSGAHYGFGYQHNTGALYETAQSTASGEVQFGNLTAGGGDSQNLQPYLTCYIWERTA